ncbi:hypothetical protein CLHOM_07680 [Clostridium homopropionicum DSM 5847]|uniref:Uncharacterized protein n=1 Tax=Clostridium homopropionicum DSM 5847 TaxID=1121318 RepID=A0A0L6ZCD5_9CLOT|nr:hypothetical protein [Clostridium homopropionicum]KOA20626.1 hypothetical protein CLHOM_07680 [Clostridium homopropionicum DSM 5847]SFF92831.1 hypothetical protein SAMN04488501_103236 [Clostridium homopropionicum]
MNKKESIENALIDKYYNEVYGKELLNNQLSEEELKEAIKFQESLKRSKEKMDLIHDLDFSMDINVMEIIQKADAINCSKKNRWEIIGFIFLALGILLSIAIIALYIDVKYILYFQLVMITFAPFALIPISKFIITKGGKFL